MVADPSERSDASIGVGRPKRNRRDCFFLWLAPIVGIGLGPEGSQHDRPDPASFRLVAVWPKKCASLLGIKGLAWRSVQIPMVMPKPDLTRADRRLPQDAGAADRRRHLLRHQPDRARTRASLPGAHVLSGGGRGPGVRARALGGRILRVRAPASRWVSTTSCRPISCRTGANSSRTWTSRASRARAPHMFGQVLANATLVEEQLADGRAFLLGGAARARRRLGVLRALDGRGFVAAHESATAGAVRSRRRVGRAHARDRPRRSARELDAAAALAHRACRTRHGPRPVSSPADPSRPRRRAARHGDAGRLRQGAGRG